MITLEIYNFIDKIAPFSTQMSFDNSGFLIGDKNEVVNKVLLSLDITLDVINECKKINANLIISHHPVIFHPLKNIYNNSIPYLLIKNNISSICAHTNLDLYSKGVNYCLFNSLCLNDMSTLSFYNDLPLGFYGTLSNEMSAFDFAKFVKKQLKCENIRFTDVNNKIKKVAVSSGSGGSLVRNAIENNCDAFVTGEIKHSDILFSNENNLSIFDVGHFRSENVIVPYLKDILQKEFNMVEFVESEVFSDKIKFI